MRLFIAVPISAEGRELLSDAQNILRAQSARGSFTRPENFHLTLAFLGETENADGARAAMRESCSESSFPLTLDRLGQFGDVWWAGVVNSPQLCSLALNLQEALRSRGFFLEHRAFLPHITLGRRMTVPQDARVELPKQNFMTVTRISLMNSVQTEGKRIYTELDGKNL